MTAYTVTTAQAETPASLPTLFLAKKGRKNAKLGESVQIKAGGQVVAIATCSYRATLVMTPIAIRRVLAPAIDASGGDGIANLLGSAEQGAPQAAEHLQIVAAAAGFERWAQAFDDQAKSPAAGDGPLEMSREVIGLVYSGGAG